MSYGSSSALAARLADTAVAGVTFSPGYPGSSLLAEEARCTAARALKEKDLENAVFLLCAGILGLTPETTIFRGVRPWGKTPGAALRLTGFLPEADAGSLLAHFSLDLWAAARWSLLACRTQLARYLPLTVPVTISGGDLSRGITVTRLRLEEEGTLRYGADSGERESTLNLVLLARFCAAAPRDIGMA